jgi:hypothetical protein
VALVERVEQGRDKEIGDAGQDREAHGPLDLRLDERPGGREARGGELRLLGVSHELLGERRWRRAVARPVEERRADLLFEAVEAAAHRRDVEREPRRGARQRALADDREKEADLVPVEGRHGVRARLESRGRHVFILHPCNA